MKVINPSGRKRSTLNTQAYACVCSLSMAFYAGERLYGVYVGEKCNCFCLFGTENNIANYNIASKA